MGELFRSRGCLTAAGRIQEKEDGGGSGDRGGARRPSAGPPPGPAKVPGASQSVTWRHSHGSPTPRCSHCVQLRLPGGTGKREELLSGAPALPRPLTAPLPAPNSQDTQGQGVGWAGRTQLHRHQQRQNPAVGAQSSGGVWGGDSLLTPHAGPASPAPCSPGERRSPPVPGGKHSDAGPHAASKLGNVGPWAAVGATQKGPLPQQSRVKSHSVTLAP